LFLGKFGLGHTVVPTGKPRGANVCTPRDLDSVESLAAQYAREGRARLSVPPEPRDDNLTVLAIGPCWELGRRIPTPPRDFSQTREHPALRTARTVIDYA